MKTTYDPHTDTLTIRLRPDMRGPVPGAESVEDKPGVILDYSGVSGGDADGNLIALEILDASKRIPETRTMQFEVAA
jgi:uncharacterized protein YuzE